MLYLSKLKNNTLNVLFGSIFLNMSAHTKWKSSSIFYQIIRFLSKCFLKKIFLRVQKCLSTCLWKKTSVRAMIWTFGLISMNYLNIKTLLVNLAYSFPPFFITNSISLLESEKFWCLFWRRSYTEYWLLHGFLKFSWPNIMAKLTVRAN